MKHKIVSPLLSEVPSAEIFKINNSEDTVLISKKGGYISIPKKFRPLPNRTNIVLTRQTDFKEEDCIIANSLED